MSNLLKITVLAFFCLLPFTSYSQIITQSDKHKKELDASQELCIAIVDKLEKVPVVEYTAPVKPKYWTKGTTTQIGFSQVSLTQWAAGGNGSVALNTYLNSFVNYKKNGMIWENRLQLGYGFIQSFTENGYKKSDDKIILDSKWGYEAIKNLYLSAVANFNTQFAPGYKNSDIVSRFFAPAYFTLGLGIDYKSGNWLSINMAPLTGKLVMVKDPALRSLYGNREDQFTKAEFGAQVKIDNKFNIRKFSMGSTLTLFSDYLDKPQNLVVNWDVSLSGKLSKYISLTVRTNLIYDDDIKFIEKLDSAGNPVLDSDGKAIKIPGVQFKEVVSLSFSYSFGDAK